MRIIECAQGTDEWMKARTGIVTASNFAKVLSSGTGRKTYMLQVAAERLTGAKADSYSNAAMERGTEQEPVARAAYEFETGNTVQEIGFALLDEYIGCSPDGLTGDDGLVEIKNPNTTTHIETVLSGKCPAKHKAQIQGQIYVMGRQWCDFVSFDSRIPSDKSLFIVRVERDDKFIDEKLAPGIARFVEELQEMLTKISEAAA